MTDLAPLDSEFVALVSFYTIINY